MACGQAGDAINALPRKNNCSAALRKRCSVSVFVTGLNRRTPMIFRMVSPLPSSAYEYALRTLQRYVSSHSSSVAFLFAPLVHAVALDGTGDGDVHAHVKAGKGIVAAAWVRNW